MAEMHRYTLEKPSILLYSSIGVKSAPKSVQGATEKFSGTFGIEQIDLDACIPIMVNLIKSETGSFGTPDEYYLAVMSSKTASKRIMKKAELDRYGKTSEEADKIMENAEKRSELYLKHAGILTASSNYAVEMAYLLNGKVTDVNMGDAMAVKKADEEYFYRGATVVPCVSFKPFRRKKVDDKDGCTAYLQNCLHIAKTPKIAGGGMKESNADVFGSYAGYSSYDPTDGAAAAGVDRVQEEAPEF